MKQSTSPAMGLHPDPYASGDSSSPEVTAPSPPKAAGFWVPRHQQPRPALIWMRRGKHGKPGWNRLVFCRFDDDDILVMACYGIYVVAFMTMDERRRLLEHKETFLRRKWQTVFDSML